MPPETVLATIHVVMEDASAFSIRVETENIPNLNYALNMLLQAVRGVENKLRYEEQMQNFAKAQRMVLDHNLAERFVSGGRS